MTSPYASLLEHPGEPLPVDPAETEPSARASGIRALLSARKLDRTLTSVAPAHPSSVAPFLSEAITERLGGGVPRGQLSEIVGPASSGRTSLAWAALAAATARGEWAALVDTFDRFDPERAAAAGITLPHLLWVRGQALSKTAGALDSAWVPGVCGVTGPGTLLERTVDRAIKALNLIVQSGVCTFVVLDLIDVPAAVARVPRSTWLRIQRVVEDTETAVVMLASAPVARSAGGLSMATGIGSAERRDSPECRDFSTPERRDFSPVERTHTAVRWAGTHDRSRRLSGLATSVRATSPRGFARELPLQVG